VESKEREADKLKKGQQEIGTYTCDDDEHQNTYKSTRPHFEERVFTSLYQRETRENTLNVELPRNICPNRKTMTIWSFIHVGNIADQRINLAS
jgi:hypothetical protein